PSATRRRRLVSGSARAWRTTGRERPRNLADATYATGAEGRTRPSCLPAIRPARLPARLPSVRTAFDSLRLHSYHSSPSVLSAARAVDTRQVKERERVRRAVGERRNHKARS